jgi:nucleotide-binding universal stress UspA family protein
MTAVSPALDRATAVARGARPAAPIQTILLASDLGSASSEATEVAVELAARLGARLLIMNALDTRRILGTGRHDRLDQARGEREAILVHLVRKARAAGATAEFMVWPGAPATAIREAIESEDADLLVVGSHGRDRAGRLVLGSVSDALVRQSPCPVLVARPRPDKTNGSDPGA